MSVSILFIHLPRQIAHSTFVNEFMNTESSALAAVDIYQALICAVIPFSHYFREGDLQGTS